MACSLWAVRRSALSEWKDLATKQGDSRLITSYKSEPRTPTMHRLWLLLELAVEKCSVLLSPHNFPKGRGRILFSSMSLILCIQTKPKLSPGCVFEAWLVSIGRRSSLFSCSHLGRQCTNMQMISPIGGCLPARNPLGIALSKSHLHNCDLLPDYPAHLSKPVRMPCNSVLPAASANDLRLTPS